MATTIFTGAQLQSLANGANLASSEITTQGYPIRVQLIFTPAASISAGVTISLWMLPSFEGTYADGGASADPAACHLVHVFTCASGAGQQTLVSPPLKLPDVPFKFVISNDTGQAIKNDTTSSMSYTQPPRTSVAV